MLKVQEIREIIKLIDQSTIDEFSYKTEGTTVYLKKAGEPVDIQPAKQVVTTASTPAEPVKTEEAPVQQEQVPVKKEEEPQAPKASEKQETVDYDYEIESPMVGTFYAAPSPDEDPFVQKGTFVQKDSVVCIVEAMKLFNEIEAEVNGEIVEILVEDGELVEYGQPLFRVKTK